MTKQDVYTFLNKNIHAVISTCGEHHHPEAALIGFGQTEQLELIFGTFKTSRKYKNLLHNNKVAFVIGWEEDFITVQYEGIAEELIPPQLETYVSLYHQKIPSAIIFKSHPDQTYFKVNPTWLRYSNLGKKEEKIIEFSFP